VVYVFGLDVVCNCMADSIAWDICGGWVGILSDGCGFGTKVGSKTMIAKVGSVLVGCVVDFFHCA
jgi:hypothetical protein